MFAPGDRVRVDARDHAGHHRTPLYLKGRVGTVVSLAGAYRNPELLAYNKPGLPARRLYRVRFPQERLWSGYAGPATDTLEADLYEHWLEPVTEEPTR